ncbi:MAG: hypothetical protein HRU04_25340 [Oceanospirillaceae bacterium]|nr:hypothetical protein [Oceanospirillaceae bacterium]
MRISAITKNGTANTFLPINTTLIPIFQTSGLAITQVDLQVVNFRLPMTTFGQLQTFSQV